MTVRRLAVVALLAASGAVAAPAGATKAPRPQTPSCDGSWQRLQSSDHSQGYGELDSLNGVTAVSSFDEWAVGSWMHYPDAYSFHTLAEHWDGSPAGWSVISTPNTGALNNYLNAIEAAAPNDVWAVGGSDQSGEAYQTLVEHWDGASWSIVPSATFDGVLQSVAVISPSDIWAVGNNGYPGPGLIEHWNGSSWSATYLPYAAVLRGISALGPSDIWAVGQRYGTEVEGDTTLTLHYDGNAWSEVPSPNPLQQNAEDQNWLTAVTALAPDDVWAVGRYGDHDGGPLDQTLIEHWDGASWSWVKSPSPGGQAADDDLWGVAAVSASDVWAVGSVGYFLDAQFSVPLTLHWDGSHWRAATPIAPVPGELLAVAAEPGGTGLSATGDTLRPAQPYPYLGTLVQHVCPG